MRDRNFRIYWFGGLTSNIGTWLQNVAASVYMITLTGSSLWVGYLNFATFAPLFLFGMWGGVLSDRFRRRRIVIYTHLFAAVVSLALAGATFAGRTTPAILLIAAFTLGSSYALAKPALSAILPALVPREDLTRATAVNILQFNLGQLFGSALATVLLVAGQPAWAFTVNSLTFFGPVAAMKVIHLQHRAADERSKKRGFRALAEGVTFIGRHRTMTAMLLAIVLANTTVEAVRTLAPGFVSDALGLDPSAAGYVITAFSVGATVGLVLFAFLTARIRERTLMTAGFALQGAGAGLVAISGNLSVAAAGSMFIGVGFTCLIPGLNAGLNLASPEAFRGRVMSAFAMAHIGLRPIAGLTSGALAAVVGERSALAVFVGGAVLGLIALRAVPFTTSVTAESTG